MTNFFVSLVRGPDGNMNVEELATLLIKANAFLEISPVYAKTGIVIWHMISNRNHGLMAVIIERRSA